MNISEYVAEYRKTINGRKPHGAPAIVCRDKFEISVQAGEFLYSIPRSNVGPWSHLECGFPSAEPEFIMEYAETASEPTNTVYGYVPIELIEKLIELHGGSDQLKKIKIVPHAHRSLKTIKRYGE